MGLTFAPEALLGANSSSSSEADVQFANTGAMRPTEATSTSTTHTTMGMPRDVRSVSQNDAREGPQDLNGERERAGCDKNRKA